MIYAPSPLAIGVFVTFILVVIGLSAWLGRRATSAAGYYAAHGEVHWFVNGIAFAGDYLSAASFLGICGMIAFYGYDGFLYSIGYLAGWIVALFVVAEPLKRLGRFTFADALDSRFHSRGIKLAAAISTLVVSLFYLIPQMVGAGALITPLLGLPHVVGVRARRRRRHPHRRHRRHGVDDLGAVPQGLAPGAVLLRADGPDPAPRAIVTAARPNRRSRPGRRPRSWRGPDSRCCRRPAPGPASRTRGCRIAPPGASRCGARRPATASPGSPRRSASR